jgi:hypothetical protein
LQFSAIVELSDDLLILVTGKLMKTNHPVPEWRIFVASLPSMEFQAQAKDEFLQISKQLAEGGRAGCVYDKVPRRAARSRLHTAVKIMFAALNAGAELAAPTSQHGGPKFIAPQRIDEGLRRAAELIPLRHPICPAS